jgi:hypothetical protein
MAANFSGRVYAPIVDDVSVTGERIAEVLMMLFCETFAKITIDPDIRFDNKFLRTLLGQMVTKVRAVPTDAPWNSHADNHVHLLRVSFTKIAAERAKLTPEAYCAFLRMRPLSISCAEGFVVISCGKVYYDKSG